MSYNQMFIFVEGEDDARFFEEIIEPKLKKKYNFVRMIKYANQPIKKIDNYIKSINAMAGDYIFVTDINNSPCVTDKKQKIQNKYRTIRGDRIIVVIKEIEGWYLAGLGNTEAKKLKIGAYDVTDTITKEQFNSLIHKKYDSRIDFMLEILKIFSIGLAKQKNSSFGYFIEKYRIS